MKKILFVPICLFFMMSLNAQSISFLRDTTSLTQSVTAGSYISMQNRFTNAGVMDRWYKWKMVSLVSPIGWTFTVCDCNACAPEGVDTASFSVASGANCIFVYDMIHQGTPGTGIAEVKVTSLSDSTDTKTVYFVGTMFLNTSVYDQMNNVNAQIYPNPAQSTLYFNSEKIISNGLCTIIDMNGQTVYSKELKNTKEESIDISLLESGNYLLILRDEENKTMITKSVVKQ